MKKFTITAVLILVVGFAFGAASPHAVSATGTSCTIDLTGVNDLLAKAKAAYASGDVASGDTSMAQARTTLSSLQSQCADKSVAASCDYVFDATIRKGPDAGLNLNGNLVLIQTSDKTVTGYVIPRGYKATSMLNTGPDLAKPNPQEKTEAVVNLDGDLNGSNITLRFKLPNNGGTITGTGKMDTSISACAGTMSGSAKGPKPDSTGDWLSGASLSSCISAGISSCVTKYGANGSGVCGGNAVALCQAKSN